METQSIQTTTTQDSISKPAMDETKSAPAADSTFVRPQGTEVLPGMTQYNMFYTTSRTNVTFHKGDAKTPAIFYGQSKIMKAKPIFNIHEGSEQGRILSYVKVPWLKKDMIVGLGEGKEETDLIREKGTWHRSDYHFSLEQDYAWVKRPKCVATAYDCVDQAGTVYATLFSGGAFNWSKGGEFYIKDGTESDLLYLLLASGVGIWTLEAMNYQSLLKAY